MIHKLFYKFVFKPEGIKLENYNLWNEDVQKERKKEQFNRKYRKAPTTAEEFEYEQMIDECGE